MTVRGVTWRLVVLTALYWLPVGLVAPVAVLLAQSRGLTLPQIGTAVVVYGLLVAVLELPTGGLADAVGRRPVLVVGVLLHLASSAALVVADDLRGFVLAYVLHALGRALGSGPVEAWYVDTVTALDPDVDVARGLGWQGAADGGGLALGAALAGVLPAALGADGDQALVVPVVAAIVLDVVMVAAAVALVREHRPARTGTASAALVAGLRAVPVTVADAVRLAAGDRVLRVALGVTALGGTAIATVELLGPPRFADLAGGREDGATALGVVLAAGFAAAALGSVAAAPARRLARGSTRAACAIAALAGAGGLGGLAWSADVAPAGAAVVLFFLAHGVVWPLLSAASHARVRSEHRSTTVSAMSLALMLGALPGTLLLPRVADVSGLPAALTVAAAVAALSAVLCLQLPGGGAGQLTRNPCSTSRRTTGSTCSAASPSESPVAAASTATSSPSRRVPSHSASSAAP